jgi:ATP adenylyltransferase/5',5'''-P-1,P-4-tetraphosphate phosphorylase II
MEHNYIVYIISKDDKLENRYFHFTKLKEPKPNKEYSNKRDSTTMLYNILNEIKRQYKNYTENKKYNPFYAEMIDIFKDDLLGIVNIKYYYNESIYEKKVDNLSNSGGSLNVNYEYGYEDNKLQIESRYRFDKLKLSEMKIKFNELINKEPCLNRQKKIIPQHKEEVVCKVCGRNVLTKNLKRHYTTKKCKDSLEKKVNNKIDQEKDLRKYFITK